jgi:hypothetical protein
MSAHCTALEILLKGSLVERGARGIHAEFAEFMKFTEGRAAFTMAQAIA